MADTLSFVTTPLGSRVATYRAGRVGKRIFVVSGFGGRSLADSPMGALIEAAGRFGARGEIVDISGTGRSLYRGDLTMELWLQDVEHVYSRGGGEPSMWIGSSLGAWLMVLLHRRHPAWFSSMCALAPAWDWDSQYLCPGVKDGSLAMKGEDLMVGVASIPRSLLDSMSALHLLEARISLAAPLHIVHGAKDVEAPLGASMRFAQSSVGVGCTLEILPDDDHSAARLSTAASRRSVERWLFEQVSGTPLPSRD